jgi:signal transduction histidine kinase
VLSKAAGLGSILERVRAAKQPAPETPTEETKNVSPLLDPSLLHTQRMKALGQMAGGVAHEFNNLLAGMAGYVELARLKYRKGESPESYLDKMVQLGDRAGRLTRQLLNFGRPTPPERTFLDFNAFIADEVEDWTALLGRRIEVKLNPSPESLPVFGDRSQLAQVLLNLCLNARDAMPTGGTVTIELRRVTLREGDCLAPSQRQPGNYAVLSVRDTGTGMNEKILAQLFTPFFSSKPLGQGTGLGLTVVSSVVRYHGGWVEVSSRAGEGACFEVYLPIQEGNTQAASSPTTRPQ